MQTTMSWAKGMKKWDLAQGGIQNEVLQQVDCEWCYAAHGWQSRNEEEASPAAFGKTLVGVGTW